MSTELFIISIFIVVGLLCFGLGRWQCKDMMEFKFISKCYTCKHKNKWHGFSSEELILIRDVLSNEYKNTEKKEYIDLIYAINSELDNRGAFL